MLFIFYHLKDQCVVYILYFKTSTDPGLLKIRHSHRFVAVVLQILIPFVAKLAEGDSLTRFFFFLRFAEVTLFASLVLIGSRDCNWPESQPKKALCLQ